MYQIWPKQYEIFLEEYQGWYTALSEENSPSVRDLAFHFQQLFDRLDLSLLSEDEHQRQWTKVVLDIRQELGLIATNEPAPDHLPGASTIPNEYGV